MIIYNDNQQRLGKFIEDIAFGDLEKNAIRAANYAGILKKNYNDYLVIKVDGYYNIVHIAFDNDVLEIDNTVYPFDDKRIYPMQQIEQRISYKY